MFNLIFQQQIARYSRDGLLKIVAFVLIIVLLPGLFIADCSFYLRGLVSKVFQQGVRLLLNYQTKDYEVLKSESFILKYTQEERELAPLILELAEEYLVRTEEVFGAKHRAGRIPLVLYGDEAALNKSFGWAGDKSTAGVYWAGTIRLVSPRGWTGALPQSAAEAGATFAKEGPLAHELTHLLVDEVTGGNYPRWLTEGLAQYVEEQITGFTLSEPTLDSRASLYSLAALDRSFDEQADQFLAYWQSLQAVRQLLAHYGNEKMTNLLECLGQGKAFKSAFAAVYGLSFADFELCYNLYH